MNSFQKWLLKSTTSKNDFYRWFGNKDKPKSTPKAMVKEIEVMFGKKIMKGNTRKRKRNKMGEGVPFKK